MAEDIVERLRSELYHLDDRERVSATMQEVLETAIAEITRLRAEVAHLRAVAGAVSQGESYWQIQNAVRSQMDSKPEVK